jgi:hypothetical protein
MAQPKLNINFAEAALHLSERVNSSKKPKRDSRRFYFDFFGSDIGFNWEGESTFKTKFGFCLSLIF